MNKHNGLDMLIVSMFLALFTSCTKPMNISTSISKKSFEQTVHIACITKMQTGEHWGAIKTGARLAASDLGADIEFYAPTSESNYMQQSEYINDAIIHGFNAIILSASHYSLLEKQVSLARDNNIIVITVDSGIAHANVDYHISSNNKHLGELAAQIAMELAEEQPFGVIVIGSLQESLNMMERVEGITTAGGTVLAIAYSGAEENVAKQQTLQLLEQHPDATAIIALEENSAHGAADAIKELDLKEKIALIAFGSSRYEISLLEKGIIDTLIVENPFNMGYLAVSTAVDVYRGKNSATNIETDYAVITKETLRTPEHQRLAFPVY